MTIHVTTTHDLTRAFKDATGWHVDDAGYLHVTKTGGGNLASFHPNSWQSVEREADAPRQTIVVSPDANPAEVATAVARSLLLS